MPQVPVDSQPPAIHSDWHNVHHVTPQPAGASCQRWQFLSSEAELSGMPFAQLLLMGNRPACWAVSWHPTATIRIRNAVPEFWVCSLYDTGQGMHAVRMQSDSAATAEWIAVFPFMQYMRARSVTVLLNSHDCCCVRGVKQSCPDATHVVCVRMCMAMLQIVLQPDKKLDLMFSRLDTLQIICVMEMVHISHS